VGVKGGSVLSIGKPGVGVAGPVCTSQAEMNRPTATISVRRNLLPIIGMPERNITQFDNIY
jgi:hypothetical protein